MNNLDGGLGGGGATHPWLHGPSGHHVVPHGCSSYRIVNCHQMATVLHSLKLTTKRVVPGSIRCCGGGGLSSLARWPYMAREMRRKTSGGVGTADSFSVGAGCCFGGGKGA